MQTPSASSHILKSRKEMYANKNAVKQYKHTNSGLNKRGTRAQEDSVPARQRQAQSWARGTVSVGRRAGQTPQTGSRAGKGTRQECRGCAQVTSNRPLSWRAESSCGTAESSCGTAEASCGTAETSKGSQLSQYAWWCTGAARDTARQVQKPLKEKAKNSERSEALPRMIVQKWS